MNDLSLMLYLADVAPDMAFAMMWFCGIPFAALLVLYLLGLTDLFAEAEYDEEDRATNAYGHQAVMFRKQGWKVFGLAAAWTALFLVPGERETYYAIAASEAGEELLESPEIGKAREALNQWLDKQLAPDEK